MEEEVEADEDGLDEIIASALIEQLASSGGNEVRRRPYNSLGPDCDELRNMLAVAVREEKHERELKKVAPVQISGSAIVRMANCKSRPDRFDVY